MLKITLEAEDALALKVGVGSNDVQIPTRTIARDDFPNAPPESLGKPVPIIYGDHTVGAAGTSASAPPQWNWKYEQGLRPGEPDISVGDEGRRIGISQSGFGTMSNTNKPTGVYCALTGGGDVDTGRIVWANLLYFSVCTVDLSGNKSDPGPHHASSGNSVGSSDATWGGFATNNQGWSSAPYSPWACHYIEWFADNQTLTFNWTWPGAATTGWKARVDVAWNYYGIRWHFYREVSHPATSLTMTNYPAGPGLTNTLAVPTNWTLDYGGPEGYTYFVTAIMADGETGFSRSAATANCPATYQRPDYLRWTAVSGALGYRVYRTVGGFFYPTADNATMLGYWDFGSGVTTATITDRLTGVATYVPIKQEIQQTGVLPTRYVGSLPDLTGTVRHAFLVAGHACKEIVQVYQNGAAVADSAYGSTIFAPGKTGYSTPYGASGYRDINGRRYTLIYATGTAGETAATGAAPLTVTVRGIEAKGDGTAGVITNIHDQYVHFLTNWVLSSYLGGDFSVSPPTHGDYPYDLAILDADAFAAAKAEGQTRVPGGYQGAFMVGAEQQETVRTWLKRLNLSADCRCGFTRRSQFGIWMIPNTVTVTADTPEFSDTLGIVAGSFKIEDHVDRIENVINYQFAHKWADGSWDQTGTARDDDAIAAIGGEARPKTLELHAVRDAGTALDIATRRLAAHRYPPRVVTFTCDMGALSIDLGQIIVVTHQDGVGPSGWERQPVFIQRHTFDMNRFTITLEALDLGLVVSPDLTSVPTSWQASSMANALFIEWVSAQDEDEV